MGEPWPGGLVKNGAGRLAVLVMSSKKRLEAVAEQGRVGGRGNCSWFALFYAHLAAPCYMERMKCKHSYPSRCKGQGYPI